VVEAASFGTAALFLVEDIEGGYFVPRDGLTRPMASPRR
jgi:hypothetical protein